jgi:hypothetical protein
MQKQNKTSSGNKVSLADKTSPRKKTVPPKKVFTKVLHPNRWFIWAIVAIVVILGGLFAYISISSLDQSNSQVYTPLPQIRTLTYSNGVLGFALQYPNGWVIDNSSSTSITFDNPNDNSESITIAKTTTAAISKLEKSATIISKNIYQNNGFQITVLNIKSTKSNPSIEVGIVQSAKSAFIVTGNSEQFSTILNSINPLQ